MTATASTNRVAPYILIPYTLCADLRDNPIAIGVYALIARTYFVSHTAIPVSAGDLEQFDRQLSYGQARRALDRLVTSGWLLMQPLGRKNTYTPTWGRISGTPRMWDMQAAKLGCPPHVRCQKLSAQSLDDIAYFTPHPRFPATITVGNSSTTLTEIGQQLLGTKRTILTAKVEDQPASQPIEESAVFLGIDHVIDHMIGSEIESQTLCSPAECPTKTETPITENMPWNLRHERINQQAIPCLNIDQQGGALRTSSVLADVPDQLDSTIRKGHQQLNPERVIQTGEWYELLELQEHLSLQRILIWQARAARRSSPVACITPEYYRACAAHDEREALPPVKHYTLPDDIADSPRSSRTRQDEPAQKQPTSMLAEQLRSLGISILTGLAAINSALVDEWVQASKHPDWALIWDDPGAAARTLLLQGASPPTPEAIARRASVRKQQQPTDWGAVVEQSGGLARLGSDLSDIGDSPIADSSIADSSIADSRYSYREASDDPAMPHAFEIDMLEDQLRMALRLHAPTRPQCQAVERLWLRQVSDGIHVCAGRVEDESFLRSLLPVMTRVLGQRPLVVGRS